LAEIKDLTVTASSDNARFPEGQYIPTINNGARELEAIIARADKDRSGVTLTSGSATAYAIITNAAYPSHAAGMWFMFRAHVANTAGATLTVNALTAKPLRRQGGDFLKAGDIRVNQLIVAIYNSAEDHYECVGIGMGEPAGGWTAATGTATRTTFVTSTVTLPQLAERVKAIEDDLLAKGILGS
jgi:hypothetical protein